MVRATSAGTPTLTLPLGASKRAQSARLPQHTPKLDPASWRGIAERARHESLRDLSVAYGVSHETIRAILRRIGGPGHTAAALD